MGDKKWGNYHRFHSFENLNKKIKTEDIQNFVGKAPRYRYTGAWKRKRKKLEFVSGSGSFDSCTVEYNCKIMNETYIYFSMFVVCEQPIKKLFGARSKSHLLEEQKH